jgi:hypothetical protein
VDGSWEVIVMKLLFGAVLFVGSVIGMLVSFFSQVIVSSTIPMINGSNLSLALGVFFILTGLGGIYIILNHN